MRRRVWLPLAIACLAVAAWLMSSGDAPPAEVARVEFPRGLRPAERARAERRRTLPPLPAPGPEGARPQAPVARDPVLVALPEVPGGSAAVIEANALRHSPIGELFVDCVFGGENRRELEELREEIGIDPLEDIDRIAFADDDLVAISGFFGKATIDVPSQPRGEKARIFESSDGPGTSALWNDELLLIGKDRAAIEAAIDRLEGRAEARPALDESMTYGEIYGVFAAQALAKAIPEESGLRERFLAAAERIELHVDTSGDVAIAAEVQGPEGERVVDLGKALGAAIALGRLQARANGQDELAELLAHARIRPAGDRFSLELALPLPFLQQMLAKVCDRAPREEAAP